MEKPGSTAACQEWLYFYIRKVLKWKLKQKFYDEHQYEEVASEIAVTLCSRLPDFLASIDLEKDPISFVWISIYHTMLKVVERDRLDLEINWDDPWEVFPSRVMPHTEAIARAELVEKSEAILRCSVLTFQLPRFAYYYQLLVERWLSTHEEGEKPSGIADVVWWRILYHFRKNTWRLRQYLTMVA